MEQRGVMNSSEYHKCMSEVYFTRSIMWVMWTGLVLKEQQSETKNIIAVMCVIVSVVYLARSYLEFREANHG